MSAVSDSNPVPLIRDAVNDVRERISKHEAYFRSGPGAEMRTRALLIDPILSRLGWPIVDPKKVQLEFQVAAGAADYVLQTDGEPSAIVEAKALRERLKPNERQLLEYMVNDSLRVQIGVLTNGREWRFYRNTGKLTLEERIPITEGEAYEVADRLNRRFNSSIFEEEAGPTVLVPPTPPAGQWYSLDQWKQFPQGKSPTAIRIDGGSPKPLAFWYDLFIEVAKHLLETGALTRADIPVTVPSGKQFLINVEPTNWDGRPFDSPKEFVDGLWLSGWGGADFIPQKSIQLIKAVGGDPASVQVGFD